MDNFENKLISTRYDIDKLETYSKQKQKKIQKLENLIKQALDSNNIKINSE